MGGEVLDQLCGEAEAIPHFCKQVGEELQGGRSSLVGGSRGRFCQVRGSGSRDGSRLLLIARGDGGDIRHRTGCAVLAR